MPFDFPATPAANDEFTSGGITYVWTGLVWDIKGGGAMGDYLPLAGGTMTGPIVMTELGALHWDANSAVSDPLDFSNGVCLYGTGTASQFGFTITSGTLNYVVQNTGNHHVFRCGANEQLRVSQNAITVTGTLAVKKPSGTYNYIRLSYGGDTIASQGSLIEWMNSDNTRKGYIGWGNTAELTIQLDSAETLFVKGGNLSVHGNMSMRDGDILDMSNGYNISKTYGLARMFFHAGQNSGYFTFHITGFGDAYVIDKVGSVGNMVSGTGFLDRSLNDDPMLTNFIEGEDTPELTRRGVNLGKLLQYALAQINDLKAEIATLKARK